MEYVALFVVGWLLAAIVLAWVLSRVFCWLRDDDDERS
jgi:hypothetical protein